jgi:hypothetical protein
LQEITLKREVEVYPDLYAAADHYYLALSKLQNSEWTFQESRAAEVEIEKTRSKLPYMESKDHRVLWEKIWTRAITIAKEAEATIKADQPALWQKHVGEFGGHPSDVCSRGIFALWPGAVRLLAQRFRSQRVYTAFQRFPIGPRFLS